MLGAAPVLSQTTAAVVHKRNSDAFVVPSFTKSSRLYRQTSILASSSSSSSRDSHGENNDENDEKVLRVPSNLFPGFHPRKESRLIFGHVNDDGGVSRRFGPMVRLATPIADVQQTHRLHAKRCPTYQRTAQTNTRRQRWPCTSSCDTRSSISASPRYEFSKRGNCSSIRSLTGTR